MASRAVATFSVLCLAIGVAGRRSQEEHDFPTSALKAVGTIVGAGVPYADPGAARPKAVQLDNHVPGEMHGEGPSNQLDHHVPGEMHGEGPSNPWGMDAASMDLAYTRHQASKPVVEHVGQSFKGHTFAKTKNVGPYFPDDTLLGPFQVRRYQKGPASHDRRGATSPLSAAKSMAAPGPIKLTYFDSEGTAEKVRLALVVGGIEFEDDRVDIDQWPAMKPTMKYGALPIMKVGDVAPFAQSGAMLRWVGQLSGLYPPDQALKIEEAIGLVEDMHRELMPAMYIGKRPQIYGYPEDMPDEDKHAIELRLRHKLMEPDGGLSRFLSYLQDFLGDNRYMCGEKVTIADCQIVPHLIQLTNGKLDGIPTTILDGFPKLKAYFDRFNAIDKVMAYHGKLAAAAAK